MKTFRQHGNELRDETTDTGHVCECCRDYNHAAQELTRDDRECPNCGALCCCACHQRVTAPRVVPVEET